MDAHDPTHDSRPSKHYWMAITLIAFLLILSSVLVVAGGSRAPVRVNSITPARESLISTRPLWRVTFAHPIAAESVQGVVVLSPTVPLSVQWREAALEIRPQRPLSPNHSYTLTIGPGLRTTNNVELQGSVALDHVQNNKI